MTCFSAYNKKLPCHNDKIKYTKCNDLKIGSSNNDNDDVGLLE